MVRDGAGHGPGAYAKDYFQCFLWKTTIGQAYDTLFMLIFISFIVLFASAFFWPHAKVKNDKLNLKSNHRNNLKNSKTRPRRKQAKTNAIINLAGIMVATCLLFFSLWQLDLIVSGPVWWQASPDGAGWSWAGPGAYSKDYFQCFLWKTTVGQAYDTLFMLIFISFIVLFASTFFWPHTRVKNYD